MRFRNSQILEARGYDQYVYFGSQRKRAYVERGTFHVKVHVAWDNISFSCHGDCLRIHDQFIQSFGIVPVTF